jgi:hypothetical protein
MAHMNGTSTATTTLMNIIRESAAIYRDEKIAPLVIDQKAITKPMTRAEVEEALQD